MSYNTRRTGGPARGGQTTQVNYHQQPSRTNSSSTARNPGYSTQQSGYNSSSQPAYSTQPGYTTAPPPPAKPAPQPQPPAAQPPLPTQPPPQPPQKQPPPQPATPVLKQEPPTPQDTPQQMETTENGEAAPSKTPFWKRKPFVKVSNKVRRARQNAKLRRILNPKNALTFLNELKPGGVKFQVREEAGWGYVASIDIDGKTFSGNALTISKAKVQASEQALKHLLLEKLSKSQTTPPQPPSESDTKEENKEQEEEEMDTEDKDDSDQPKAKKPRLEQPEDDLPWGSLAAFALHKLFAEWQKEGTEMPPMGTPSEKYDEDIGDEAYFTRRPAPPEFGYPRRFSPGTPYGRGRGFGPYPPRGPPPPAFGGPRRPPPPALAYITSRPTLPIAGVSPSAVLPMKKIPEDANKRHPVMLLNQLKPNVIYNESREGEPPRVMFNISVEIEGKEYVGRGKSKKEAKKNAAKAALAPLGIIYSEED